MEADVSKKNKKMPPLRVGLLPIGIASTPPLSSEGGGKWPTAAATRPGLSHRQSGLDLLDLPPMPRTRSIFHCLGLHLHHRLCRWGEGWRRPATIAVEPPFLTAHSSCHRSPPTVAVVAEHRTRAWIRVADAVGGGREEACSSRRRLESSRHHSSLDLPLHDLPTHTHTQTEKGSDLMGVTRCRLVAWGADATLGGGARLAWLWWHPVVQELEATSSGAGAQCGIGWWCGWSDVEAAPGHRNCGGTQWWRRSEMELEERRRRLGIGRACAEVKIRMRCGHLSSALCLADGRYGIFHRLYPGLRPMEI
jgi:hypothetical protein